MTKRVAKPIVPPADQPAPIDDFIIGSVKALHRGDATEHQQRRLYDWITLEAAGVGQQSFRAGDPYATAFMDGRRFVGIQLIHLLKAQGENNGS